LSPVSVHRPDANLGHRAERAEIAGETPALLPEATLLAAWPRVECSGLDCRTVGEIAGETSALLFAAFDHRVAGVVFDCGMHGRIFRHL
jgi:hypothetical protein